MGRERWQRGNIGRAAGVVGAPDTSGGKAEQGAGSAVDLTTLLRAQGLRVTAQRLLILEAVRSAPGHVTAEDLYQQVRDHLPALSIVSVYRTLEFFAQRGILTRTSMGARAVHWEWHVGPEHHHLICRSCGSLREVNGAIFADAATQLQRDYGFQAEMRHVAVWGICAHCQAATP